MEMGDRDKETGRRETGRGSEPGRQVTGRQVTGRKIDRETGRQREVVRGQKLKRGTSQPLK